MGVGDLVSEMALETQIPPVIFWMLDAQGWTHTYNHRFTYCIIRLYCNGVYRYYVYLCVYYLPNIALFSISFGSYLTLALITTVAC